jgi:aryl carrier-like protein
MLPSIYLPVDEIPVAATGKADRRKLREIGDNLSLEQLLQLQSTILPVQEHREPSTTMEKQLCELWAQILNISPSRISARDNFLRLGGDSVAAMLFVAAARQRNLSVAVANVFKTPVLADLTLVIKVEDTSLDVELAPFSLLGGSLSIHRVREEAARLCKIDVAEVEDIYPCTALQEGMLSITARSSAGPDQSSADNLARTIFELPSDINISRLEHALTTTIHNASILRTRVINLTSNGLVQVVLNSSITLNQYQSITDFIHDSPLTGLGFPLYRAGLIPGEPPSLIMEMHHSIFDGWSTRLILDAIEAAYHRKA